MNRPHPNEFTDLLREAEYHIECGLYARALLEHYSLPAQYRKWWQLTYQVSAREACTAANAHLGILQLANMLWGSTPGQLRPWKCVWPVWLKPSCN